MIPFLTLLRLSFGQETLVCREPVECVDGIVVGQGVVSSYAECQQLCQSKPICAYFTFITDSGICLEFSSCGSLDVPCTDCLTGERDCPIELICDAQGFCDGVLVGFSFQDSADDCLRECQAAVGCGWYSYDTADSVCVLTEDCRLFDHTCVTCTAGEVGCSVQGLSCSRH